MDIPSEDKQTLTVNVDLDLFRQHHLVLQEGPALSLELLSAEHEGIGVTPLLPCSITDQYMSTVLDYQNTHSAGDRGPLGRLRHIFSQGVLMLEKSGRTVLLVDDEPQLCRLMQSILERNNSPSWRHRMEKQAELIVQGYDGQLDLVLADMEMPGMTGIDLARRLKTLSPALRVMLMSVSIGTVPHWVN
jgi:PleD family two-component response regulator